MLVKIMKSKFNSEIENMMACLEMVHGLMSL